MAAQVPLTTIGIQFLESAGADATPARVRARLAEAFEVLPISIVILGWHLPPALEDAVAAETSRHNASLYRWHPLLASDTGFHVPDEWRTVGLRGDRLPGFRNLPEFTFMCPSRADVQDWIAERIESEIHRGLYQGFFFDRIRFPSPTENFPAGFACFCAACARMAADSGLDLESVRRELAALATQTTRIASVVKALFAGDQQSEHLLQEFLKFRSRAVTRVVRSAAKQVSARGLSVGLDCFSPSLTHMVGQDMAELTFCADWIKIMTYPRAFGPAGLPFELLGLADSLTRLGLDSDAVRDVLELASGLPLPARIADLRNTGFGSETIQLECSRGRTAGIGTLLAGVALVEMEEVHESTAEQIDLDLRACRAADGMILSWDLWQIPRARLDQVRRLIDASNGNIPAKQS